MTLFRSNLCTMLLALTLVFSASDSIAETTKIGVVGNLSGVVTATSETGETRHLKAGDPVYLNENISSAADAKAQIMFLDKSALMINPNTSIVVDKFVYDPATASGDLNIHNAKGALRFIGGALSKAKPVSIKTPVATIGIRGGIADAIVGPNGATDTVFVYGDELTMANGNGQVQRVTTPGMGLSMLDANSMPVPLPPARAAAISASFSNNAKGGGDNANDGQSNEGDGNSENGDAPDAKGKPEAKGDKAEPKGAPKPKPTLAQAEPLQPLAPPIVNVTGDATQVDQRITNLNEYSVREFIPTDRGMYVLTKGGNPLSAGRAEFEDNGERLSGRLIQAYPNPTEGPRYTGSLPWLAQDGFQQVTGAAFEGFNAGGVGFRTDDGAMSYYDLNGDDYRISMIIGNVTKSSYLSSSVAASGSSYHNVNGITFYDFLPDLAGYKNMQRSLFDYNVADSRLAPGSSGLSDNLGMVVNWNTNKFITGQVTWENSGSGLHNDLVLAFGDAYNGNILFDGDVYEINSFQGSTASHQTLETGVTRSVTSYTTGDGDDFSGMLLEAIMPTDPNVSISDAFNLTTDGPRSFQGLVQSDGTSEAIDSAYNQSSNPRLGFAGGFVGIGVGNAVTYKKYLNDDVNDVYISPDHTNGSVGAHFLLERTDSAGSVLEANFGTYGTYDAHNAYLTDNLYAAQQNFYKIAGSQDYIGDDVAGGVLVSASLIADVASQCDDCEYVDWGVWAGEIDRGTSGSLALMDVAHMVPYVSGVVTPDLAANVSPQNFGDVDYSGVMFGSVLDGNMLTRHEGSFVAGINLNTRQLTDFDANLAGMNFGFNGTNYTINGSGHATFANVNVYGLTGTAADIQGSINGALFGPNAEDIGGNFAIQQISSGKEAAGIYIGTR